MFSLAQAELLVGIISLIFAYVVSVTVIGTCQCLVAQWAGDSTPAESGFLSLNPLYYSDIFGFLCLIFFGFGWGKTIPFNPLHVDSPYRSLRVLLVYLIEPFMALVLAGSALTTTLLLLGPASLSIAIQSVFFESWINRLPIYQLAKTAYGVSQVQLTLGIVCLAFFAVNTFLAVWRTIHNACYYTLFIGTENGYSYMKHMNVILFIAPLVLLLTIAPLLMNIFVPMLIHIARSLTGY